MRFILLIILLTISFSASAQWWRLDLKIKNIKFKKHHTSQIVERPPILVAVPNHSIARLPTAVFVSPNISLLHISRSEISYQLAEASMIKTVQRNMRYGIYSDASYNFSELARLYLQQNRLSEAKWYLLQSNSISRQQGDNKHTISNLIDLAVVKANAGDYKLALQDLEEAHSIARYKGFKSELTEIDQTILFIKQQRDAPPPNNPSVQKLPGNVLKQSNLAIFNRFSVI